MFRDRRSDSIGARVAAELDVIVPCCFYFGIEDGTYVPAPNPHTYGVLCHHMHADQNQACKMAQSHFAYLATQYHPDGVRLTLLLHQETNMATR